MARDSTRGGWVQACGRASFTDSYDPVVDERRPLWERAGKMLIAKISAGRREECQQRADCQLKKEDPPQREMHVTAASQKVRIVHDEARHHGEQGE